jgi:antitoxin component YwqK of YwqJK toxin-antitoxin module
MPNMEKALLVLSLLVLVGCDDPTGGGKLAITKHENGKTSSRGYVIPNTVSDEPIKVGDWVYYYKDGQKEKQGSYLEDQMHGTWTFWLPGGSESWTAEYKNGDGNKNGVQTLRHANGQKLMEGSYKEGKKEGVWTYWDRSGQKVMEGTHKAGKKEGVWTFYYEQGNVTSTEIYRNGKLVK